ncbi:MAG TPA: nuclear transport factor 2 family protein [Saprospiraceae bacterium]|nr:nuclear transport factor 2 family protein [Saprospiraceae bacterium]
MQNGLTRCIMLIITLLITSEFMIAQIINPDIIVQRNLDYYNQRDIEGFMSCFSENITIHNFSDSKITASGLAEVKKIYGDMFTISPNLHSTILKRIVFGNKVIDHESIVGRNGSKEILELVLIYEVEDNKISKITVLRKS